MQRGTAGRNANWRAWLSCVGRRNVRVPQYASLARLAYRSGGAASGGWSRLSEGIVDLIAGFVAQAWWQIPRLLQMSHRVIQELFKLQRQCQPRLIARDAQRAVEFQLIQAVFYRQIAEAHGLGFIIKRIELHVASQGLRWRLRMRGSGNDAILSFTSVGMPGKRLMRIRFSSSAMETTSKVLSAVLGAIQAAPSFFAGS